MHNSDPSYTVTSHFDVLVLKFWYQKQRRLSVFYSVPGIFIDLSFSIYVCVPVGNYPSGALKMRSVMCISYCLHNWQTIFIIFFSSFWTVDREKNMCVSLLLSIILVLRLCQYDRKDEQTNEWTNRQTAIPNTVYPSLRERVVYQ
jgi:hypothetical protein